MLYFFKHVFKHVQRINIFGLLCLICLSAQSQTNAPSDLRAVSSVPPHMPGTYASGMPVNTVRTWQPLIPFINDNEVTSAQRNVFEVNKVTQFMNGAGQLIQTVNWQSAPDKKDIVSPVSYDVMGREKYKYLSYVPASAGIADNGLFKNSPFADQAAFYYSSYSSPQQQPALKGENILYSQTNYEASPLGRVEKKMGAGNSWTGNALGIQQQYLLNTGVGGDAVRVWSIGYSDDLQSAGIIPVNKEGAVYAAGELFKNVTIDEAQHKVVEFKNKEGQLILKKVQLDEAALEGHSGWLCTYYVYDDLHQLRFVMPPKAVEALATAGWNLSAVSGLIDGLCFRYEYDKRKRKIARKAPAAGWVYMIYDSRDRLVFTQDAYMRSAGRKWWLMNIYDMHDRTVQTAVLTGYQGSRADLTSFMEDKGSAGSTLTNMGNYSGSVQPDYYVNMWQHGIEYKASNSVVFQTGFESGNNAEFTAEIATVTPVDFTTLQQVNGYAIPGGALVPLTYTYYDDYNWGTDKAYSTADNSKLGIGANAYGESLPAEKSTMTSGLMTGSRVRVLEDPSDITKGSWLETANFYDDKGRTIQVVSDNYKGGRQVLTKRYNFTGKVISSYHVHSFAGAGIVDNRVYTETDFDHAGRITEIRKMLNDDPATRRIVTHNTYDALGMLLRKELGQKSGGGFLETQDFTYNIRGWIKGVNWEGYDGQGKTAAKPNRWFAMDLSYDWGYDVNQFNGNIAGVRWQSAGDQKERSYGYGYDAAGRFLYGDFKQYENNWNTNSSIDFSTRLGDGITAVSAYDANGNIKKMAHKGMKGVGASSWIDELKYTYYSNSNQLKSIADRYNESTTSLGDFRTAASHALLAVKNLYASNENADLSTVVDYVYDDNGNLLKDLNKEVGTNENSGIVYNHLNLPYQVQLFNNNAAKGTVTYIYDANGVKLEKKVWEKESPANGNAGKNTVTSYVDGLVYENQVLQYVGQEAGRIRPLRNSATNTVSDFVFDYFLKDQLSSVRAVVTDEAGAAIDYVAGMEERSRELENSLFDKIPETVDDKPQDFDAIAENRKVIRLSGTAGSTGQDKRIGPGIVLKVMKGDKFRTNVKAWYVSGTSHEKDYSLPAMLESLASAFAGGIPVADIHGTSGQALQNSVQGALGSFLNVYNQEPPLRSNGTRTPKAYLNWILLDEQQLQVVNNNTGAAIVPDIPGGAGRVVLQANSGNDIEVTKNGYLYVFVSNESKGNVYFDDFTVVHTPGPLLEETHYYPFGLTMAGISSKAAVRPTNKIQKFQGQEFNDDFNVDLYEFRFRMDDPQTGRFWQVDPLADKYVYNSTYAFSENKVTAHVELEGLETQPITDPRQALYAFGDGLARAGGRMMDKMSGGVDAGITFFKELFNRGDTKVTAEYQNSASASFNFNFTSYINYVRHNGTASGGPDLFEFNFSASSSYSLITEAKIGSVTFENNITRDDEGNTSNKTSILMDYTMWGMPGEFAANRTVDSKGNIVFGLEGALKSPDNWWIGLKAPMGLGYTYPQHGSPSLQIKAGGELKVGSKFGFKLAAGANYNFGF